MSQAVDYVDHSAELYELPPKVSYHSRERPEQLTLHQGAKPIVTYSKAIQTSSVSTATSTDDLGGLDEDGVPRRAKEGGSGRETEDEMRQRILHELEEERKTLENDLRDLRKKEDQRKVSGELPLPMCAQLTRVCRHARRSKTGHLLQQRVCVIP